MTAGNYTVNLTATNSAGNNTSTRTDYITVHAPVFAPVANFTANVTNGTAPLTVNFTDLSTNTPTTWSWSFGDGNTSTVQNSTHTYTTAGNYTVNLTATNAGGSNTTTKTNYITAHAPVPTTTAPTTFPTTPITPLANFNANITNGTAPLSVQFTDASTNSPTAWAWDFGDIPRGVYFGDVGSGTVKEILPNGTVRTLGSGFNNPKDVAVDSQGNIYVPESTTVKKISAVDGSVSTVGSGFTTPQGIAVDSQGNLYVTDSDNPGVYKISATDHSVSTVGSGFSYPYGVAVDPLGNVYVADVSSGVYKISAGTGAITQLGGSKSFGFPQAIAVDSQGNVYVGDALNAGLFKISATDGSVSIVPGTGDIVVYGVDVDPLGNLFVSDWGSNTIREVYKDGTTVTIGSGFNQPDGISLKPADSYAQNPVHTYVAAGNYTVNLTATNAGGSNTSVRTDYITVHAPVYSPVANFTANVTNGTAPLSVNFTDLSTNTPTTWQWEFGDGNTSTVQNSTHTYMTVGNYTVNLTATNAGGSNISVKTDYITVHAPVYTPVANFTANVTNGTAPLTVGFTDLSTNTPTTWQWEFGDGNTSTKQNPVHIYATAGNYTVNLTATNAGGSNTSTRTE
jgi:PKD repeat protein